MVNAKHEPTTGIRFNAEDKKLIRALNRKLGIKMSEILRLALRALADKENVTA